MPANITTFLANHQMFSISDAKAAGISRASLSHWARSGRIQRLAQGLYASADEIPDDLQVIASRSPNIVFSHETALALHRLHNRIPLLPSVSIPTGARLPRSLDGKVSVYHAKPEFHGLGRSVATSFQGHAVPCYDAERTICDIVRSRSRMDDETFLGGIRAYGASLKKNFPRLFEYAQTMGIENKVRQLMEVFA